MAFALLPHLLGSDWWDAYDYPAMITDQFFGNPLLEEDLLPPSYHRGFLLRPRTQASLNASGKSEVANEPDEFKVSLNVSQFRPEELEVKIVDDFVVVHGKHEEKCDEHGLVSREFTRRYMLPKGCEQEKVTSTLTPEGVLVVEAPKAPPPPQLGSQERQVPISQERSGAHTD